MELKCNLCREYYDLTNHLPRITPWCCFERLCSLCISRILKKKTKYQCGICSKTPVFASNITPTIENFPIDMVLEGLLNASTTIVRLKEPPNKIKKELESLNNGEKMLNERYVNLEKILEEKKNCFVKKLKEKIKQFNRSLNLLQLNMESAIIFDFDIHKKKLLNNFGKDSAIFQKIKKYQELIGIEPKLLSNERLAGLSKTLKEINFLVDPSHNQEYEKTLETILVNFESEIVKRIIKLPTIESSFTDVSDNLDKVFLDRYETTISSVEVEKIDFTKYLSFENRDSYLMISRIECKDHKMQTENFNLPSYYLKSEKVYSNLSKCLTSEDRIKSLAYAWSLLEEVSCLKMRFEPDGINDDQLEKLPLQVLKHKGLEKIGIDLEDCKVSDESVCYVIKNIYWNMYSIKSLSFNLCSTLITDETIQTMSSCLFPIMGTLERFDLYLAKTNISDKGMSELFTKMSKLKRFKLNLRDCIKVTKKSVINILDQISSSFESMEELELDLSSLGIYDENIQELVRPMPCISTLILKLNRTNITDNFLLSLFHQMKSLKVLQLSLESVAGISDSSITAILNKVCLMRDLEILEINVQNTKITDSAITCRIFNMHNMKHLYLNLSENTKISDIGVIKFVQNQLKEMRSLNTCSINLSNTVISGQSLYHLSQSIKYLKELTKLYIFLERTNINDKNVEGLLNVVKDNLRCLKKLNLDVKNTNVSRISEKDLKKHIEMVKIII